MALYKLSDFDPNYRDHFENDDVKGLDVYSSQSDSEKIGKVNDVLVDEDGSFRYLIVDTGFLVFGKKVMLPIGLARIDYNNHRVYANLSKKQAEDLPEFSDDLKIDKTYESNVRNVYRPSAASASSVVDNSAPLNTSYVAPVASADVSGSVDDTAYTTNVDRTRTTDIDVNSPDYTAASAGSFDTDRDYYQQYPDLYATNDRDHQRLRLYEERVSANKRREKTGDVVVGKRVETTTQHVAVPVEKERIVIERTDANTIGTPVTADDAAFNEGEVARVEVYEEVADIRKEPVLREEVQIRKEVSQDQVESDETIRREELDVNTQGNPIIDRRL